MLSSTRSLRPLGATSRGLSSRAGAGAASSGARAPARRLLAPPRLALRVACRAGSNGGQQAEQPDGTNPEQLEAMADRLLAAKQAGASRPGGGEQAQPGAGASSAAGAPQQGKGGAAAQADGNKEAPKASDHSNLLGLLVSVVMQRGSQPCAAALSIDTHAS